MPHQPDPEIVARALARRRTGESYASIARDCGVTEGTIRRWVKLAPLEASRVPPPILADAPPEDLSVALERIAAELDTSRAIVIRRAIDLLRATSALDEDLPDAGTDTRAWLVAMISRTQRSYLAAEQSHNAPAAKQYASVLERWAARLRQHDAQRTDDAIVIPRAELDLRLARLREHMFALAEAGPLCASCGKRVRMSWVGESADP